MSGNENPWIWSNVHNNYYYYQRDANGNYIQDPSGQYTIVWHSAGTPTPSTTVPGSSSNATPRSVYESQSPQNSSNPGAVTYQHSPPVSPSYVTAGYRPTIPYTASHQPNTTVSTPSIQSLGISSSYWNRGTSGYPVNHSYPCSQYPAITPSSGFLTTTGQSVPSSSQLEGRPSANPRRHVTGRNVNEEILDPRYRIISPQERVEFFCLGRVFSVLWTEPAGGNVPLGRTRGSTALSVVRYNQQAHTEIRRFVVVHSDPIKLFSICVPVHTYHNRATTKPGVCMEDHAIIHTSLQPPRPLEGEVLVKMAIPVIPSGNETLSEYSRVNFGKPYTVEHNLRVMDIGKVNDDYIHLLPIYHRQASGSGSE